MIAINTRRKKYIKKRYKINTRRLYLILSLSILMIIGMTFLYKSVAIGSPPIHYKEITVEPGDNLWTLVEKFYPQNTDIRKQIHIISQLNHLQNSKIYPGQVLKVPDIY